LEFVKLQDYMAERSTQLAADHEQDIPDAEIRRRRWTGEDSAHIDSKWLAVSTRRTKPNPEVVRAEGYSDATNSQHCWSRTAPAIQRYSSFEELAMSTLSLSAVALSVCRLPMSWARTV